LTAFTGQFGSRGEILAGTSQKALQFNQKVTAMKLSSDVVTLLLLAGLSVIAVSEGCKRGAGEKTAAKQHLIPGDFEDDSDAQSFNGVAGHVCYENPQSGNALMRGVDAGNNRFMCTPAKIGALSVDLGPPQGTQGNFFFRGGGHSVHVCPGATSAGATASSAMVGWIEDHNWLICAPASGLTNVQIDLGTQENEGQAGWPLIHVCNGNRVMVGISAADNVLICADHP
jgi:hypothetical protein